MVVYYVDPVNFTVTLILLCSLHMVNQYVTEISVLNIYRGAQRPLITVIPEESCIKLKCGGGGGGGGGGDGDGGDGGGGDSVEPILITTSIQ